MRCNPITRCAICNIVYAYTISRLITSHCVITHHRDGDSASQGAGSVCLYTPLTLVHVKDPPSKCTSSSMIPVIGACGSPSSLATTRLPVPVMFQNKMLEMFGRALMLRWCEGLSAGWPPVSHVTMMPSAQPSIVKCSKVISRT